MNPIYKDIQPTLDIIGSNHITGRVKYITVPIHYIQDEYVMITIDPVNMKTTIQPSNIGTKGSNTPLLNATNSIYVAPNTTLFHKVIIISISPWIFSAIPTVP